MSPLFVMYYQIYIYMECLGHPYLQSLPMIIRTVIIVEYQDLSEPILHTGFNRLPWLACQLHGEHFNTFSGNLVINKSN